MKLFHARKAKRCRALFIVLLACVGRCQAQPAALPVALINSAFEDKDGNGVPEGWELHPGGNNQTTFVSLVKDEAGNALKIVDNDPNGGAGIRQFVPGTAGHEYAFSVESKGGSIFLYLNFRDAQKHLLGAERRSPLVRGETWHTRTMREVAPPGTAIVEAWLYAASDTITGILIRNPALRDEGIAGEKKGPLLSDKQFFDALNLDFPGLEAVRAAVLKGDLQGAKAAYLQFRRTRSKARFQLGYRPDKPAGATIYPAPLPTTATATSDAADAILAHKIAMPWGNDRNAYFVGEDIDWTFNPLKSDNPAFTQEWTFIGLNRFYFWINLADAYWKTLDEKYAREWVAQLTDWVEDNPLPLEAGPGDTIAWRGIEAATRMNEAWPYAYFHFLPSSSLTPQAHATYVKTTLEHALRLERILLDFPEHGGNWAAMELRGLATIGSLFPELKRSPDFLKIAFDRLNAELAAQVYPDGGQTELSTMYAQDARENFGGAAKIAALNNAPVPGDFMERFKAMYRWNLRLMDQRGVLPPVNDVGEYDERVTKSLQEAFDLWGGADFLWGASGGKSGQEPPLSSFLPYSGLYAMRGGWKLDDLYVFFDAGPVGTGHWHEDMLNLYLRAWDKTLLTEAGGYAYDQSKLRSYVLGTTAHNTITVDGKQQRRGQEHAKAIMEPVPSRWSTSPLFDYAAGTYDAGYQQARYKAVPYFPLEYVGEKDKSVAHTRHVLFLKPFYVLAVDFLNGQGEHRYDAYFHLDAPDATIDAASGQAHTLRTDGVQLGLYPLERDGLQISKAKGQENPMLGWVAWQKRAIPTVVYTKQAAAPATFATLLYPYKGASPAVTMQEMPADKAAIWSRRIITPHETVEVLIQRRPGSITGPKTLAGAGFSTDAPCVVLRQPAAKAANKVWIGLYGARRAQMGKFKLSTEAPANLLASASGRAILLFNAGDKAVTLQIDGPLTRKVRLDAGLWTQVTPQGETVLKQPPALF